MPDDNKDLKKGDGGLPAGDGQPDKKDAGDGSKKDDKGEETVTMKKSELDAIIRDRDNYKAGLLLKKADERDLKGGDGGDKGGEKKVELDEAKVKEIATQAQNATLSVIEKSNESKAKLRFLKENPEYVDDGQWQDLMTHFAVRRGRLSVEDILEDMGDAILLHKRATGKLDEHLQKVRERGRQEGRIEAQAGMGREAGGVGERTDGGKKTSLSPEGEEMSRRFGLDPKKVAEVPLSGPSTISVVKQK